MEEFDLNNIWNQSDDKADDYYNSIKSELMEKAQKNSNNILEKIKKNIRFEWAFSILLGIFVIVYTLDPMWVAIYTIASLIMWLPYRGLLKSINSIQTQNITDSLKSYIDILNQFIKRLKIISILGSPLAVIFGILIIKQDQSMSINELFEWSPMLYLTIGLVCYTAFMFWAMFKWYIPALYGNPKKELEEILAGLNQEIV